MNASEIINTLTANGGNLWEKGEMRRVYFSSETICNLGGMSISTYNSGNINHATLDGEKVSNSEASRIVQDLAFAKVWYDVAAAEFKYKGIGDRTSSSTAVARAAIRKLNSLIGQQREG